MAVGRSLVGPFMYHDELGYLATARLTDHPTPELYGPSYGAGWGLLIWPLDELIADPSTLHQALTTVNAVVASLAVFGLFRLATEVFDLSVRRSLVFAVVAALTPITLVTAQMLVVESFLTATFPFLVIFASRLSDDRVSGPTVALGGALVGLTPLLHPRMIGVVASFAVLVIAAGFVHRRVARSAAYLAAMAAGFIASETINAASADALYPFGTTAVSGPAVLAKLASYPESVVRLAFGSVWYAVASSFGLAAVGAVSLVYCFVRASRPQQRAAAAFALLSAAALLMQGAIFLAGPPELGIPRPDIAAYGRYLEPAIPVLILCACLYGRRIRALGGLVAVAIALAAIPLFGVYDPTTWTSRIAYHNVAGLYVLLNVEPMLDLLRLAPPVLLIVGGATAIFSFRMTLVAVLLAATSIAGSWQLLGDWAAPASAAHAGQTRLADAANGLGAAGADVGRVGVLPLYNYMYWYPDLEIDLEIGTSEAPMALTPIESPPTNGRLIGTEVRLNLGLFATDPELIERLDAEGRLFPPGFEFDTPLPDSAAVALVEVDPSLTALAVGEQIAVTVQHAGTGSPWPTLTAVAPVVVAVELVDSTAGEPIAFSSSPLQQILGPGDTETVMLTIPVPPQGYLSGPDGLAVRIGVVRSGMRWFGGAVMMPVEQ